MLVVVRYYHSTPGGARMDSVELRAIDLFADDLAVDDVFAVLRAAGFRINGRGMRETGGNGSTSLSIVDGRGEIEAALMRCRQLRANDADAYTPILFVAGDGDPAIRLASMECGADTSLARPFAPAELLAQVRSLIRVRERSEQLAVKAADAQRTSVRLHEAKQQMDQELELARRLQESFLPQSLPALPGLRFAVKYKPYASVGGDFYDVFRLDEKHIGFYIADAMGHGVASSLLTIFVKKGVRAKEITGKNYRLVPPNEVLARLNSDLIDQQIPDLPFITMAYMLYNVHDRTIQFSRAGHPYPLYIPKVGKPDYWQLEGSLLGVFETHYRQQVRQLNPGDKLLLYTDGMDAASFGDQPVGMSSLLAAAETHRALPVEQWIDRLASDLFTQTRQSDDLTLVGMELVD